MAYLRLNDLLSCMCTGQFLHNLIQASLELQYRIRLATECMDDNPSCSLGLSDRFSLLFRRQKFWRNFIYDFRVSSQTPHIASGMYDLKPDAYLLGIASTSLPGQWSVTRGVQCAELPRTEGQKVAWSKIAVGRNVLDFGTAIEEHNLIAFLTVPELNVRGPLEIELIDFRSGSAHPKAIKSTLTVQQLTEESQEIHVNLEIVGENLALVVYHHSTEVHTVQQHNFLYLYNWKLGSLKTNPIPVQNTGLVFLAEDVLMLPINDGRLDIYYIPPTHPPAHGQVRLIRSFMLPRLADPSTRLRNVQCRGEPNPRGTSSFASTTRPFSTSVESSIILISFDVMYISANWYRPFTFIVHRKALLPRSTGYPARYEELDPLDHIIPWSDWGPSATRWFPNENIDNAFITTSCGTRWVYRPRTVPGERRAPLVILDFNPYLVRREIAAERAERRGGPINSWNTDTAYTSLVYGTDWFSTHGVFRDEVGGSLPYIEVRSKEQFEYDAVMLSEEHIIVTKGDPNNVFSVQSFECFHFG
ncbi:hypothetical protein B0H10DRAFT_2206312 [Mycena sp. CBHHK59/15]|nr:hypothetical protein B0H10DRAFT_2206312 [Mycena sp. CBHHK59/15]